MVSHKDPIDLSEGRSDKPTDAKVSKRVSNKDKNKGSQLFPCFECRFSDWNVGNLALRHFYY